MSLVTQMGTETWSKNGLLLYLRELEFIWVLL